MMYKLFSVAPKLTGIFLFAALLCCVSVIFAHREWVNPIIGLSGLVLGFLLLACVSVTTVFLKMRGISFDYWFLFLFGFLPITAMVGFMVQSKDLPMINDVTTNLYHPPAIEREHFGSFDEKLVPIIKKSYSDLESLQMTTDLMGLKKIKKVLSKYGFEVLDASSEVVLFYKSFTTAFMRFTDHMVVRCEISGNQVVIDMRSKSVYGQSDFGVNAGRIRQWHTKIKEVL